VFSASFLPSQFTSLFLRFFTNNSGWTLPALFATLRDLRDLAFDVSVLPSHHLTADIFSQADVQAQDLSQKSECMEEAARVISKAFSSCITDR
jgi:hypothetical protein